MQSFILCLNVCILHNLFATVYLLMKISVPCGFHARKESYMAVVEANFQVKGIKFRLIWVIDNRRPIYL